MEKVSFRQKFKAALKLTIWWITPKRKEWLPLIVTMIICTLAIRFIPPQESWEKAFLIGFLMIYFLYMVSTTFVLLRSHYIIEEWEKYKKSPVVYEAEKIIEKK